MFLMAQGFLFTRSAWSGSSNKQKWYQTLWPLQKQQQQRRNKICAHDGSTMRLRTMSLVSVRPSVLTHMLEDTLNKPGTEPQWKSSIEIMADPIMHAAYSKHVERFLCFGESVGCPS
jgi:hypothetical protein